MTQLDPTVRSVLTEGGLSATHIAMGEEEAARLLTQEFGIHGQPTRMATEKDDTFAVRCVDGTQYVMKVANPCDPPSELDFQLQLIQHVGRRDPSVPVPRVVRNCRSELFSRVTDAAGQSRCASLLTFLPGTPLDSTASTPRERERVGEVLARLRLATADFSHPADGRLLAWDMRHLPDLRPLLAEVDDPSLRERLAAGMDRVEAMHDRVLALRTQVLHNDFSRSNIIVDHDDDRFVTGIIDFGDSVRTAVAVDVSSALLNQLPRAVSDLSVDLFADGRDVLRGYLSVTDLTEEELGLVPHLVMARVVARALITLWRSGLFPDNAGYILRNTEQGWGQLEWFMTRSVGEVSTSFLAG